MRVWGLVFRERHLIELSAACVIEEKSVPLDLVVLLGLVEELYAYDTPRGSGIQVKKLTSALLGPVIELQLDEPPSGS